MRKIGISVLAFALAGTASAESVDEAALQKIHVTSGRSSVWAKFNQPAVHVWLPQVENSAYAGFELAEPAIVDAKGRPVELDVEQGFFDPETGRKEFRFRALSEPARVSGKVRVRYPVRIRPAAEGEPEERLTDPHFKVDLPKAVVEEWREIEIRYDLPIAELLPEALKGEPQPIPETFASMPDGQVEVVVQK